MDGEKNGYELALPVGTRRLENPLGIFRPENPDAGLVPFPSREKLAWRRRREHRVVGYLVENVKRWGGSLMRGTSVVVIFAVRGPEGN